MKAYVRILDNSSGEVLIPLFTLSRDFDSRAQIQAHVDKMNQLLHHRTVEVIEGARTQKTFSYE